MSIKSWFQFSIALLFLVNNVAFCKEIVVTVSNNTLMDIYVSAKDWSDPDDNIIATPAVIPAGTIDLKEKFSNVKQRENYFEVYFNTIPNDQNCVFTYEFSGGFSVVTCQEFNYTLSQQRENISINSINPFKKISP